MPPTPGPASSHRRRWVLLGLLVLGAGAAFLANPDAGLELECFAQGTHAHCQYSLTALHNDPYEICWSLSGQCKNSSSATAEVCEDRARPDLPFAATRHSRRIPVGDFVPKGRCDSLIGVTATVTRRLRLSE